MSGQGPRRRTGSGVSWQPSSPRGVAGVYTSKAKLKVGQFPGGNRRRWAAWSKVT